MNHLKKKKKNQEPKQKTKDVCDIAQLITTKFHLSAMNKHKNKKKRTVPTSRIVYFPKC